MATTFAHGLGTPNNNNADNIGNKKNMRSGTDNKSKTSTGISEDDEINIEILSSCCASQKRTNLLSNNKDDEYSRFNTKIVTKVSKTKIRQPKKQKRIGFRINDNDLLYLKDPTSFQSHFPCVSSLFSVNQNSFDRP